MNSAAGTQLDSEIGETLSGAGKLQLADRARLMGDNQRLLSRSSAAEQAGRDYAARVREAEARQTFGQAWPNPAPAGSGAEDMQIYIDSPVTIHAPAAATPVPAGPVSTPVAAVVAPPPAASALPLTATPAASTLGKLALTAALAAVGGGALTWGLPAVGRLLAPPAVTAPVPTTAPAVYDILPWRPDR